MKAKTARSGPSLVELVVAVLLFALCSAVCVKIFVTAKLISDDSANLSYAVVAAQSAAECFKSCGGDATKTANLLDGSSDGSNFSVYYNEGWNCVKENGKYILFGEITEKQRLKYCKITVNDDKNELFSISVASHGEVTP